MKIYESYIKRLIGLEKMNKYSAVWANKLEFFECALIIITNIPSANPSVKHHAKLFGLFRQIVNHR
jgi:hypothetical protein